MQDRDGSIKDHYALSISFSHVAYSNETPSLPDPRAHLTPIRMDFPCVHLLPNLSSPKIPSLPILTNWCPICQTPNLPHNQLHHLIIIETNWFKCNKLPHSLYRQEAHHQALGERDHTINHHLARRSYHKPNFGLSQSTYIFINIWFRKAWRTLFWPSVSGKDWFTVSTNRFFKSTSTN